MSSVFGCGGAICGGVSRMNQSIKIVIVTYNCLGFTRYMFSIYKMYNTCFETKRDYDVPIAVMMILFT